MVKTAVLLCNLGGPDRPAAVRPFLFNLFNDPAIIGLPWPLRPLLAGLIARRRAPVARAIYAHLGGASPLLANTRAQATALQTQLNAGTDDPFACFVAMRYWHPFTRAAVADMVAWEPDRVVVLPLYPQFSTTTAGSSLRIWRRAARAAGLQVPAYRICCWPVMEGFVRALARGIESRLTPVDGRVPRVLFSAHGLPEKIVARGDPYQWQVEQTAAAVAARLDLTDWLVCYQSRVGPLKWIGPETEAEIDRAGREKTPLLVVPLAFVSEHSETLVELDIEYAERARTAGVPAWRRAPAVGTDPDFIAGLADLVRTVLAGPAIGGPHDGPHNGLHDRPRSAGGGRLCGVAHRLCPAAGDA